MPFTFAHPAIVLPLRLLPGRWFSLTGLIIGSLTPDFEYFIRMRVVSKYSHTITGLLGFDLFASIFLAFVFHNVVRNSLIDNLPVVLKTRLSEFKGFDWNDYFKGNWWVAIISILIGGSSHLFWDSFTHEHGYFVEKIPVLSDHIILWGNRIPGFKILQHSSTLIGGFIIAFCVFRLPINEHAQETISFRYWGIFIVLTVVIIAIRLLNNFDYKQYGNILVTVIAAQLIALILTPLLIKFRGRT
jgi:hypothetical protein